MRKITNAKRGIATLLAVALIVFILVGALAGYYFWTQIQITPSGGPTVFDGTINVTINEDNYLSRGTSVSSTSDSYIAYRSKGKTLEETVEDDFIGGQTFTVGTAKGITLDKTDNGHFFVKAYAGTDYYLHVQGTDDANDRITGYKWVDVDNDNRLEVVFDVDVSNYDIDPNTTPSLDIIIMSIQEDGSAGVNSPSDQTSIATGTVTGTIEWQLTTITEKYGEGFARVYVISNETTHGSLMDVTSIEIDQIGIFSGGDIVPDSGAKAWYVDIGINDYRELVEAVIVERPSGGKSYVGITVSFETYFTSSGQGVTTTLKIDTMDADETLNTQLSDAVVLQAT